MKFSITICILLLLAGCKERTAEQRYVNYINDPDNKITQEIKIGEIKAIAKWLPDEYRQLGQTTNVNDPAVIANDAYYFFDIKFEQTKGDKPAKEKILYLDFDMQKDFVLLEHGDSLLPAICQKIENGISGSYQYLLAFEKKQPASAEKEFSIIYKDKIFGIGTIAFVYKAADIEKIPTLKDKAIHEAISKL